MRELRRKVGFVFQAPVMFPGTVRKNLDVALELGGAQKEEADDRVTAILRLRSGINGTSTCFSNTCLLMTGGASDECTQDLVACASVAIWRENED